MPPLYKTLLFLLCCLCCISVSAQPSVNVKIYGIDGELETNVRLYLSIEQQKDHPLLSEGRIHRLHKKAPQEISNALQPYGYYRPKIETELNQTDSEAWQAIYTIESGPQLRIAAIDLDVSNEMFSDVAFHPLIANLPLRQGEGFTHINYEKSKANLAKLAAERGYFDARFIEHRVEIDLDAYEARITLHYDSGPRFHFGEVVLAQDVLESELLQRYIPFEQGDPYDLNQVIELQQALNDSDYFQLVEVSPGEIEVDDRSVPISVILTPRKRHKYTLGLGYGTDTGARTKFGWEMPRINRLGHRFDSELNFSQIGYSATAHYRIPVFNPRTDQMVFSAGIINEETDTSISTIRTLGASLNRSRNRWRQTLSINYQQEEFEVADDIGDSTLLMPGISWSRIWGSRRIFLILDGVRFDLSLRGASDKFISDTNFSQATGSIKAIRSVSSRGRLIAHGKLGSTWTRTFHQLPSSVRFFAGGAQSVRGYAYESLGPRDADGEVEGGKHLMVGSLEYDHRIKGKWRVALFYDRGNAINATNDPLEEGAGFGIRWQSPVGPIRFDFANAISRDDRPWRFHINIGPDL